MDCLFCEGIARCHIEPSFNYTKTKSSFQIREHSLKARYFCMSCQTFLSVQFSIKDTRSVLEKVPKLFDCAINFDKGLLS